MYYLDAWVLLLLLLVIWSKLAEIEKEITRWKILLIWL